MKKILLLLAISLFTVGAHAQKDVVSVADMIKIFQAKTLQMGKQVLEKQGYVYKGVSSDAYGKDYNWVKNRTAFAGLQAQVKAMGYDMGSAVKGDKSTLICTKDNQPTISFLTLQQPLPYCLQITE